MTNSQRPAATRFERVINASPRCVSHTREELGHWLQQELDLDSMRFNDVVLAVYEALANAAEYAYLNTDAPGSVTMVAVHDPASAALTLTVADNGRWRETSPLQRRRSCGRGIPLIKGLSDRASIDTSAHGTTVRMVFDDVPIAVSSAGAGVASH